MLLTPLAPGEAYAADVARLNGRAPIGPADDAWLALAHALVRAEQLPPGARAAVLAAGGAGVAALVPADGPAAIRTALLAAADGLCVIAGRLGRGAGREPGGVRAAEPDQLPAAVGALQAAVAQQEQAGAFALAFGTLAALRAVLAPVLDRRAEGLLLAQQGRVARQLGAMASAAELYAASVRAARAARAPEVAARALIGAGSLATVRGNYPDARHLFRQGLSAAARAGAEEHRRAGHHGLMVAALAARDVETALAHGWAAFRETSPDAAEARAEMLVNLGAVGRQAGEHRAALGACLSALELTNVSRIRLPALGTAALSAAHLGERRLFEFLAKDLERSVTASGQPFENARALVEFAEAAALLGDKRQASAFGERAASLAQLGPFHEVAANAERMQDELARTHGTTRPANGAWSSKARDVLRSMERLSADSRYAARAM